MFSVQPSLSTNAEQRQPDELPILYRDSHLIAINKPSGLLVHRSQVDRHETRFALQTLRDQIGQYVYPVHRLDKPTSGVLLFALDPGTARHLSQYIEAGQVQKSYLAVVRGFADESGFIDHALHEEQDPYSDRRVRRDKPAQRAQTRYHRLATRQLDVAIETYPQSRYSLVQCQPITGRKHQLRRHLKHIGHPIIGDAKHGRGRHNRYFRDHLDAGRLLLHAATMRFVHPHNDTTLEIHAPLDDTLQQLLRRFDWLDAIPPEWHHAGEKG